VAAGAGNAEAQLHVGWCEIRSSLVRPFHEARTVSGEIFVEASFQKFIWNGETIKIKVI